MEIRQIEIPPHLQPIAEGREGTQPAIGSPAMPQPGKPNNLPIDDAGEKIAAVLENPNQ